MGVGLAMAMRFRVCFVMYFVAVPVIVMAGPGAAFAHFQNRNAFRLDQRDLFRLAAQRL